MSMVSAIAWIPFPRKPHGNDRLCLQCSRYGLLLTLSQELCQNYKHTPEARRKACWLRDITMATDINFSSLEAGHLSSVAFGLPRSIMIYRSIIIITTTKMHFYYLHV